jgi:hypothetical protein
MSATLWCPDIPRRCDGNVDGLVTEELLQIVDGPCFRRFPVGGGASHNKRGVAGDKSHEFEGTWLFIEFFDNGAIEFIVICDELCNWILIFGVVHVDIVRRCLRSCL